MEKQQIEFKEFIEISEKLQINVGKVTSATHISGSKKLLEMNVDFGDGIGMRKCVTNLGESNPPEWFVDQKFPFVMNLKPVTMMGVESEVMIMVSSATDGEVELGLENFSTGGKLL